MISVSEARAILEQNLLQLEEESVVLKDALGRTTSRVILSPVDHPLFDQTAVDGYAFRYHDLENGEPLSVVDEIAAGSFSNHSFSKGDAARIFTGAAVPAALDTVVMQELTDREGDIILIKDQGLKVGSNIRRKGEQLSQNSVAVGVGTQIVPAGIGLLASLGISEINCVQQPKIGILVTGDEFADDLQDLTAGKIFESNGKMLVALLQQNGITANYAEVKDDLGSLEKAIADLSQRCDIIILTGGVSVGEYDYTLAALENTGFKTIFHQVAQKPGKPLLFAARKKIRAFGLPGNPRAVLLSFYQYVLPFIEKSQATRSGRLLEMVLPLAHSFKRKPDQKTHFVSGKIAGSGVTILEGQASHMLQSMVHADCIVELGPDENDLAVGDLVTVKILPRS